MSYPAFISSDVRYNGVTIEAIKCDASLDWHTNVKLEARNNSGIPYLEFP
jgi:hypothetical protein